MNNLLEKHLIKTYPKIFKDMYGDPKKTCMAWGISCADGWFFLLNNICAQIQHHIDHQAERIKQGWAGKREKPVPQVVAQQIKEKFGTLRFYYSGGDNVIRGIIQCAEALTYNICENCGRMDHTIVQTKGWIQHLCVPCANEFGKDYIADKKMQKLWDKVLSSRKKPARSWDTVEDIDLKAVLPKKPTVKRKKK